MADEALSEALSVDLDDLTIEEIELIEDIIGGPFDDIAKPGARKGKLLRALAFISKRRVDPSFTIEDAGRLKITLEGDKPVPTDASGTPES